LFAKKKRKKKKYIYRLALRFPHRIMWEERQFNLVMGGVPYYVREVEDNKDID
jgi:hypothetical protein